MHVNLLKEYHNPNASKVEKAQIVCQTVSLDQETFEKGEEAKSSNSQVMSSLDDK